MPDEITASVDPASGSALEPRSIELLAPGTRLGDRYEIRKVLGSGGQAVVYLATDRDLNRDVALKILRSDRSSAALEQRFHREAAIARDAAHPNLVRIFDIEATGSAIYLSMEHVAGESLRGRIVRGPMPIDEIIDVATQILLGVDALHSLGIIHRDIKPGNVLTDPDGVVKVADFGLARHLSAEETRATNTGAVIGTIDYVSPEQALGKEIDVRSDLYSTGVVLFEMLTARVPFSADSQLGLLLERLKAPAPDVRRLRPDCPPWLARVVARLLERERENRYASARAVLQDIARRRARIQLSRRSTARVAGITLALVLAITIFFSVYRRDNFSHFIATPSGVAAVDHSGATLWAINDIDPEIANHYAVARIGGSRLIAAFLYKRSGILERTPYVLSLLDPRSGRVVRTLQLPVMSSGTFSDTTDRFVPDNITAVDLDHDGSDEIVIGFTHMWNWPSAVALFEPRINRVRWLFLGSGHHRFATAADVDGDGHDDIILGGINNGLGWYNAITALKIEPPVNEHPELTSHIVSSPDAWRGLVSHSLIWYELLPRGMLAARPEVTIHPTHIEIRFVDGRTVQLTREALTPGKGAPGERARSRRVAFDHLSEADRLLAAGVTEQAEIEFKEAVNAARTSAEPLLLEAISRRYGRFLIATSRVEEGVALLESLARSSDNRSEIEFDAAQALHLRGDLRRAAGFYLRGIEAGGRPDQGKNKMDFIEGAVLSLCEIGRYDEAIAACDRFAATFPESVAPTDLYRQYVRWRSGKPPRPDLLDVQWNATDFVKYCVVEMELAAGKDPASVLRRIDRAAEAHSQIRGALLSLRAETLARLGHSGEARDAAIRAYDLAHTERLRSTWAHAQYSIVRERFERLTGTKASD